nr:hypothetical protein [Alkalisalibacterium limincola]
MRGAEVLGKVRCQRIGGVEAQVGFPVLDVDATDQLVERLEVGLVRQRHRFQAAEALGPGELAQAQVAVAAVQVAQRLLLVAVVGVAQFHQAQRAGRQAHLDADHAAGLLGQLVGRHAGQRQHALHMAAIASQQGAGLGVLAQVVVAIGQAQPTLGGVGDGLPEIGQVDVGTEVECHRHACRMQRRDRVGHVARASHAVDLRQQRGQRAGALRLDSGLVQAARQKVASIASLPPPSTAMPSSSSRCCCRLVALSWSKRLMLPRPAGTGWRVSQPPLACW